MVSRIPPLLEGCLALPAHGSLTLLTNVLGAATNWLITLYLYSFLSRHVHDQNDGSHPGRVRIILMSLMRSFAYWRDAASKLGLDLDRLTRERRLIFVDGLSTVTPVVEDQLAVAINQATLGVAIEPIVLILDQPDLLLAMTDGMATRMHNTLLTLRQPVHATIVAVAADEPLLAGRHTMLERQHAAFVLGLAHQADQVLAVRPLDSGAAADVSGVVRVTRGGALNAGENVDGPGGVEHLYVVGVDGGARVFTRGE